MVLVAILAILPFALRVPDAVMRTIYPLRYEATISEASEKNDLEPAFIAAVIYTESRFRPDVESHQEAYGLMQLLPQSARYIQRNSGIEGDYRDPKVNIRLGTWFLGYLNDRYEGDERLMLAAYNSGEGSVDAWTSDEGLRHRERYPLQRDPPVRGPRAGGTGDVPGGLRHGPAQERRLKSLRGGIQGRRDMRRKLAVLLVASLVPMSGAVACGQAVEDRVKQEVDKQVQKGEDRVNKELEKGQKKLEKEAGKVQKQIEEGAQDAKKQAEK